eukprot:CCRYP_013520-RB/>CCRYP_013520-RB protein AED:0.49 eAED:0.93 QI:0/0/0/1/0/0/2/0/162
MAEKKHIQHRHRERQQKFDKQLRGPSQHRHAQLSSLDDIPLHKMGSCRQIVMIVCIILIEKYALPTFFGNSYGSTELSSIPDLLFAMLNNPGYLIVLTRLPVASGETTDLSKVSTAITNEHAKCSYRENNNSCRLRRLFFPSTSDQKISPHIPRHSRVCNRN